MILSKYFSRVALFNTPVELSRKPIDHGDYGEQHFFRVGPLEYAVTFVKSPRGGFVIVDFMIHAIHASDQEKAQILSKIFNVQVDILEIPHYYNLLLTWKAVSYKVLGTGSAPQILSNVINIVTTYIETNHPKCMLFSASEKNRSSIYRKLVKRLVSDTTSIKESPMGEGAQWKICFEDQQVPAS